MLQPMLRRRLRAAASPLRLALGAGLVLGGAAAGLAPHTDADAPREEAGLDAGVVVADAAQWQPPWLRPPRSVVLEDVRTRASASDPLSRRPRRRVRLPGATAAAAHPEPGSGIDVPASVAAPDSIRESVGGGDIPPPVTVDRERVPLPAWDRDPVGPVVEGPYRRARKAPVWEAPAARVASTSPAAGSDAPTTKAPPPRTVRAEPVSLEPSPPAVPVAKPTPPPVVSDLPVAKPTPPYVVSKLPVATPAQAPAMSKVPAATATPLPVVSKLPVATPTLGPAMSKLPVVTATPLPAAFEPPAAKPAQPPAVSEPPDAKSTTHPVVSKLPVLTPAPLPAAPQPAPVTPTLPVIPVAKPAPPVAPPAAVVSLRPILPGVPAELAPPSPPSDVIVWQRDEVENLVAADAFGHGRGLQVAAGGHLGGSGRVGANVRVAGVFAPGHSPGYVEIEGDYVQDPGATLEIELAGTDASDFDRVVVEGNAYLSGVIQVLLLDGFVPTSGDVFEVLLAAAILHLGVDIQLPDLGSELSLQADWLSTEAGDSLVLRAQRGASAATTSLPEPATALLLAVGLVGLALWGRSV